MKMPDNFKIIGSNVLIRADMEEDEYEGGIVVPETLLVHDWRAEVVQAGGKCEVVKKGDIVLYKKEDAVIPFSDSQEYRITKEKGIVAKLQQVKGNDFESIMPMGEMILCRPDSANRMVGGIHLPDKKVRKTYRAEIVRCGEEVDGKIFGVGRFVFFDTTYGIHCYEDEDHLCLISVHDILCVG
jgi:co-chaperonin GroES (HSP10)